MSKLLIDGIDHIVHTFFINSYCNYDIDIDIDIDIFRGYV